jgi:hypothetical protein
MKMNLLNIIEKTAMTAYFPIAGMQALAFGACVAIFHSKPIRYLNGAKDANSFSEDSATRRFKEGIDTVLNVYGYFS